MDSPREHGLDLVSLDDIHPHELADAAREARIERRLAADGVLRDPLIVGMVPHVAGYVLLDGTNRLQALRALGLTWGLVQIIDYSEHGSVTLRTWCHRARTTLDEITRGASTIPGVSIEPIAELGAADALATHTTIALLLDKDRLVAVSRAEEYPHSRAEQLRLLVDLYEDRMTRLDCDPANAEELAQSVCGGGVTLVAFPTISRSQVATMAIRGTLIPAGITRHVISEGRALRVNVPLAMLNAHSVVAGRRALTTHLDGLQPRLYREPTILYDS